MREPARSCTYRERVPSSPTVDAIDRRFVAAVAMLAVAAVGISIASLELIHPMLSWNRDEPVYLWHVGLLDSGRLTASGGSPLEAFRPWLSGVGDDGYFSQYTLGWPLVLLAASRTVGTPAGAVVLGSVLFLAGAVAVVRELTGRNRDALVVGAAALTSPVIVIQAGVHLSYLFTAGLGTVALALAWSALRRERRLPLVAAGVALGWVLLTRPFDAVVWGAVLVVGAVLLTGVAPLGRRVWGLVSLWPLVLAGLPFAVATIAYNLRITGEALTFPIVATDPLDTFGFGRRRLMPAFDPVDYGLGKATFSTVKNGGFFVVFLAGNVVTLLLAVAAIWWRRASAATWVLVAMAVAFPLGYFAFWGMWVSSLTARLVGAIYYVPSAVPVLTLGWLGLMELRRRSRLVSVVAVVAAIVVTLPVLVSRLDVNRRISEAQEPWATSVEGLAGPALVIVAESGPYVMFKNPIGRNDPGLEQDILYAADLGPDNLRTIEANPDRAAYLQVATADADELGPRETPVDFDVSLAPIEVLRGRSLDIEVVFTPPDGSPVVVPFLAIDGDTQWMAPVDAVAGPAGSYTFTTTIDADDAIRRRGSTVRVGFGAGDTVADALADPRIRWDVTVGGQGDELVALLPAQQFRRFAVGRDFYWYPRPPEPGVSFHAEIRS